MGSPELPKPVVYISVVGGIAEYEVYPKSQADEVEVIHIDWDEYEDNVADVDNVLLDIEDTRRLVEAGYENAWLDFDRALERSVGFDLEAYDDENAAIVMDALEKAGHPYELSEGRQLPMDLLA